MERKSIKKEYLKGLSILIITYGIGCWLNINLNNKSDLITFLSIMMGFFMTALSFLFSSPLYEILQNKERKGYPNKWVEIVDKYFIAVTFSMIFILLLLISWKIPEFSIYKFKIKIQEKKIYFGMTCASIYLFSNISWVFFKNLKFPINQN
ncbi:hypothetical protein [uncultured Lactobacillus sp.]|uniref:hypothetical protein n=1 Tax=uncultured Lactobacillus sp. TaxID=153152 RepID=UPI00261FD3A7|nr:hypothetical protein [uncultured Lactobacillus sp.]